MSNSRLFVSALCISLLVGCTATGTITPGPLPSAQPTAAPSSTPSANPNPLPTALPTALPSTSPAPGACYIASSFDTGSEGWSIVGDVENATGIPQYQATGGNPGGHLLADDDTLGGVWYWSAPASYLGDLQAAYRGSLSFELKQSSLDSQFEDSDVIIEGAGMQLALKLPQNPGLDWTSYSVKLDETAGWKLGELNGRAATAADLQAVLGNVTRIWIRGEYVDGADTGGLDNVRLQKNCASPLPIRSTFDNHDDQWLVVGDAESGREIPQYASSGGNTGGYIFAEDDAVGGVWYWSAPAKFLGNQAAAYNKRLSFDLKQSSLDSQFDDVDIVMVGGGKRLVLDLPNNPGLNWTNYSISLSENSAWKLDSFDGKLATSADIRAVLSDLTQLWIRGEYVTGNDIGSLDNVIFGG